MKTNYTSLILSSTLVSIYHVRCSSLSVGGEFLTEDIDSVLDLSQMLNVKLNTVSVVKTL